MPLHVFGHVEAQQFDAERGGELLCDFGLADAGRTREQIAADRLLRLAQARARQLDRGRQRLDRLVLAEHHALQGLLEMLQHLGIVLRHALGRNPRHGRDRRFDFLDADGLLALVLGHQHLRRAELVDHVDRLVGQLAVVDVARGELHRGLDRLIGVFQPVIVLEIRLQALEDRDRVLDRRLVDVDLLEAPHQRAVLLEVLAVFLVGGRAHAADRARGERGLEQIGGIHRAAGGGPCPDHGVDLVDEQDGVGMRLQFLQHLLQPLLEIAAVARAREQRAHVEREHGGGRQHFRHLAVDDALGEALGDRGLADAGIADEQRIVLLAAAQHLDGAVDLGIAADHRIDLAVARLLVEVDAIGLERLALLLGVLVALGLGLLVDAAHRPRLGDAGPLGDAVADVVDGVVARHVLLLQEVRGMALALGEDRDQHVGAGHFFATGRLHMDHRALDHALEAGGRLGIVAAIGDEVFEFGLEIVDEAGAQLVEIDAAGAHHGGRIGIVDQRQQEMFERRVLVVTLVGDRQRTMQGLFKALGKSRHSRPLWPPAIMIAITLSGNNNLCHLNPYSYARSWRKTGPKTTCFPLESFATAAHGDHPRKLTGVPSASSNRFRCKTRSDFAGPADNARYFFSITHCSGCWCLRAKSITCVTLVSAIS